MKDYTQEAITIATQKAGAFWAFGDKQFNEQRKPNVGYISMGAGLVCPKKNARQLAEDIRNAVKQGAKKDIEENGIPAIIERELANHEAYYTGDITDTVRALSSYEITAEQVQEVYNKTEAIYN